MKKIFAFLFLIAAFVAVGPLNALAEDKPVDKGFMGDLLLKTDEGKDFSFKDVVGKKVMFVIVQTACSQCRIELQDLSASLDKVKAKADVYAVLVDVASDRAVKAYKDAGYKLPLILDPGFALGAKGSVDATPATIVVGKDGKVAMSKTGYRPGQLEQILDKL